MLNQVIFLLGFVALTVALVLYLRTQSLKQFERAVQARLDAMRSGAELREISAATSRRLRDAAVDEARRTGGRR
jgi:hypothetical protein